LNLYSALRNASNGHSNPFLIDRHRCC